MTGGERKGWGVGRREMWDEEERRGKAGEERGDKEEDMGWGEADVAHFLRCT